MTIRFRVYRSDGTIFSITDDEWEAQQWVAILDGWYDAIVL